MAVSEANSKVDDGWRYCSVCRKNHEEERKHIFTKKHLSKLKILMGKFLKKVHCLLIRSTVLLRNKAPWTFRNINIQVLHTLVLAYLEEVRYAVLSVIAQSSTPV